MGSRLAIWAFGVVPFLLVGGENGGVFGSSNCGFPAIFNFGDSNSDTGASSSAAGELLLPSGITMGKKSKRIGDGRLIIDFLSEELGLPYLNATVDSIGTSFKHGANFATGGGKIAPPGEWDSYLPFSLDIQISQFLRFKSRSLALYDKLSNNNATGMNRLSKSILPEPEVFSKALYTIDIGQNDMNPVISQNWPVPPVLDQFYNAVQRLLNNGAKFLWVHNTGPFGCLSWQYPCKQDGSPCPAADEHGCARRPNNLSQLFNNELKDRVNKLRAKYPDAVITLVDVYSAKYSLFVNPHRLGFIEPAYKYCCGTPGPPPQGVLCGTRVLKIGGTTTPASHYERANLTASHVCEDPSKYIIWDAVHYTEAANRIVAKLIANGSHSDPPLPITKACHKH